MKSKILKRSLLFVAGFLFQGQAEAQMYVSPNSYVFANNEVVYVKQDLELNAATSNFYLRNDAQLLQGTAAAGANKGVGKLSVYQEGTVNNFQYNYWCSPVGNTTAATALNRPFGIDQLTDVVDLTNSNAPVILAMNNYNGISTPLSIAPYWIWKFVTSSTYAQWVQAGSTATVNPGEGFTMKGTSGSGSAQRYDFRGKPNDGDITNAVSLNNFTLVGNPYPSAIDLNLFLTGNANSTGVAYFWEHDKSISSHFIAQYQGGYGMYTGATSTYVPATFYAYDGAGTQGGVVSTPGNIYERRFCPIGQGFMVRGAANGNVTMSNSYRVFVKEGVGNLSEFERFSADYIAIQSENTGDNFFPEIKNVAGNDYTQICSDPSPHFRINSLFNNSAIRQVVLTLDNRATDGVDFAMDAKSPSDYAAADFYFLLDNDPYAINAIKFDVNKRLPLGFKCTNQTNFKVKLIDTFKFDTNQNVFIHDKLTDIYYDIKNGMFDMTLPAGDDRTSFELTFKDASLAVDDVASQSFVVYQNNNTKNVTIGNPLQVELSTCGLYDISGKLIFSKKDLGTNTLYEFPTSNLSDGIYIVKLITKDNTEIGKKIMVKN